MTATAGDLVPGRSCGGCTLCCKLLAIDVLAKPRGRWCQHCNPKRGCTIYADRPEPCRGFHCGYLRLPDLDERWKPSKARFLINYEDRANRIVIHADPDRPDAWRVEPYYSTIKGWAANAARQGGQVLIWAGDAATLVLPNREAELGRIGEHQIIVPVETRSALGVDVTFIAVDPDDPRA